MNSLDCKYYFDLKLKYIINMIVIISNHIIILINIKFQIQKHIKINKTTFKIAL